MSFLAASFPPDVIAGAQAGAAKLAPDDNSLAAERLRGIVLSHRDWVFANGGRARLRAQWRELFKSFDAVICPIMPTPAYPHDHSPDQEKRRIDIDGKELSLSRSAGLARHRHAARPAGNRDSDRAVAGRAADRRADRGALAGGPHAVEARRTDRARIRRLCSAADVRRLTFVIRAKRRNPASRSKYWIRFVAALPQ